MKSSVRSVIRSALLFQQQKRSLPQTLILFVTSRCNARCDFCLYYEQITNPVAKKEELTIAEYEAIARQYGKLHYLSLSGGEPFIRKDLEPLCQSFIDHCDAAVVDIPSNFYYTDTMLSTMEPLVRNNPDVIFELCMSIDHVGEAHDKSRHVKHLYSTAMKSFRALSAIRAKYPNLKLKVNIVYLDSNRDGIDEIISDLHEQIESDRVLLTYPHDLVPEDSGPSSEAAREVDTFIEVANTLTQGNASPWDPHTLGLLGVKRIYHRLLAEAVTNERNVGSYCEAGRYILVVSEKGDVFPCEPLWKDIGNVRDHAYDLRAVIDSDAYKEFRTKYLGKGKCNCTWSCAMHSSVSVTPKYLPEITLNAARNVLRRASNP